MKQLTERLGSRLHRITVSTHGKNNRACLVYELWRLTRRWKRGSLSTPYLFHEDFNDAGSWLIVLLTNFVCTAEVEKTGSLWILIFVFGFLISPWKPENFAENLNSGIKLVLVKVDLCPIWLGAVWWNEFMVALFVCKFINGFTISSCSFLSWASSFFTGNYQRCCKSASYVGNK